MKRMSLLLCCSALVLALAAPAMAKKTTDCVATPKSGYGKYFFQADTDKDGAMSEAEYVAQAKGRFAAMDANKDGKVTMAEFRRYKDTESQRTGRLFFRKGCAVDTTMSEKDFEAAAKERFAAMDTNKDGKITVDEFQPAGRGMGRGRR